MGRFSEWYWENEGVVAPILLMIVGFGLGIGLASAMGLIKF